MGIRCAQFEALSRKAVTDQHLRHALKRAASRFQETRDTAFSHLEDAEALREQAHKIKEQTLDRLDEYLEHLEKRVIQLGGKVHWAPTARQARRLVEDLAIDGGVRTVVKGKSMITEELGLNEALIARGIEVSETDLGEFIIQLAGEAPSHIVVPAIHRSKEQIAQLFSQKLGIRYMEDPQEMAMFARKALRERFLAADMGITGVNFAVAETGSIVLFENEGNIRLTTTLPRIHVAVMGVEKVIPGLDDLSIFVKLLARSATGQELPSYVSIINGPRKKGEHDGAEAFHLVIIDNGRNRILANDDLKETLYCIRCGACLNSCPVYLDVGGHAYGWVYSGPIGSILTPQLISRKQAFQLPYASTLCGACEQVCPVKINIPRILVALRQRYVEDPRWGRPASPLDSGLFALYGLVMKNRWLYEKGSRMARILQSALRGHIRNLPYPLDRWSRYHEVSGLAKTTFRERWK